MTTTKPTESVDLDRLDELRTLIENILSNHRMVRMYEVEDDGALGNSYPLIDRLCLDDGKDTQSGLDEVEAIADAIVGGIPDDLLLDIAQARASQAAPSTQPVADERALPKRWQDRLPPGAGLSYDYAHVSAMKQEIEEWRATQSVGQQAPSTQPVADERALFEASEIGSGDGRPRAHERNANGDYAAGWMQQRWEGWQAARATQPVGQQAPGPIYQVQFPNGGSAWHDASETAYHTFMPQRRRIVYAAPVSAPGDERAAACDGWNVYKAVDAPRTIVVSKKGEGFVSLRADCDDPTETVLYRYFEKIAAAPAAQAVEPTLSGLVQCQKCGATRLETHMTEHMRLAHGEAQAVEPVGQRVVGGDKAMKAVLREACEWNWYPDGATQTYEQAMSSFIDSAIQRIKPTAGQASAGPVDVLALCVEDEKRGWYNEDRNAIDFALGSLLSRFKVQMERLAAPTVAAAGPVVREGMLISMDVSTGESDAYRRVFGRVTEVMLQSGGADEDTILAVAELDDSDGPLPNEPKPCRACDPSVGVACEDHAAPTVAAAGPVADDPTEDAVDAILKPYLGCTSRRAVSYAIARYIDAKLSAAPDAEMAKDAARYRWLRNEARDEADPDCAPIVVMMDWTGRIQRGGADDDGMRSGEDLDQAVDAALSPHVGAGKQEGA